jgi:DNA (cytosine-5)-methyltransferase 1
MKYISLFSGIGGFDLGFDRAGMECVLQVEKDEKARAVLAYHWPDVPRMELVEDVTRDNIKKLGIETVDLICGGFPCQDVSSQGLQRGIKEGTRSGLWFEFSRIIGEIRPQWAVIENVRNLLSIDSGGGFATVLRNLAQNGYDAEWACIPASRFGANHQRYRVFIVAYPQSIHEQSAIISRTKKQNQWNNQPGKQVRGRGIFSELPPIDPWLLREPRLDRVANGIPNRVDRRLRQLGNAIVPQVAEWIGKRIMAVELIKEPTQ